MYYRNHPAVIKSWDNRNGSFELLIEIDGIPKKFSKENENKLDLFLANFSEVEVVEEIESATKPENNLPALPKQRNNETDLYKENKETFKNLAQILIEDIDKVREDSKYVPQAKQVCNSVNALVAMTKLQIQLIKQ